MGTTAAVIFGTIFVLLLVWRVTSVAIHWRVGLTSPRGIASQLRSAGGRHEVRVGPKRYGWNPSEPMGRENRLYGPGTATYWLDDADVVHLEFVPTAGTPQQFEGPFPTGLQLPSENPSLAALVAAPACGVIGFLIADIAASGSTAHRLAVGFVFGIVGWVVGSVVQMTVAAVTRTRALAAQTR